MALFLFFLSLFPALPGVRGGAQHENDGECPGGAHCKGGEQSLPTCPAGFFCPAGNGSVPVPCPPGTFRPAGPAPGCLPCPGGSFGPRPAQSSCLPCGSGAVQPAEGQSTCVCRGAAQVYQPRDGRCTCPPGFRSSGRDGNACARRSYPVCRDSASRNQEGHCLTPRGWARYCSQKVCAVPRDFQGYDKVLGLCLCRSDSLERVCNSQCRKQQKSTLQLSCAEKTPQLLITRSNGSQTTVFLEGLRKVLPRPNFSLEDVCAAGQQMHPVHLVGMSGKGFLGVYNPDPQLIQDLLVQDEPSALQEMNPPPAAAPDPPGPEECREQILSPPNSTSQPPFLGILNPITCISSPVTLLFLSTQEHFPLYDVNNLYNTNAEFDWGDFRSLREEIREIPRNSQKLLLFLFQFQAPGTYVLQLSSNRHKRMYLRVMPAGTRCQQDGPFLPSTPRAAVQVGIAPRKEPELRLSPDWAALAGLSAGLLLLLAAGLALPLLCRGPGCVPRGSPSPAFRRRQLRYSLDGFCSPIPAVISRRKTHPSLQLRAGRSCGTAGTASFPGRGEPWEPEEQMDLEDFNTKIFFELLLRQSQSVTTTLGHFKEEVKVVYHRVMNEISLLKKLWLKALSIPAKGEEEEEEEESTRDIPRDPRDFIPQKLIPVLQSLLQMLQENRKNNLSPESPASGIQDLPAAPPAHNWLMKKNQNFLHPLSSSGRHSLGQKAHPGEETVSSLSPSELEDKVDALTEELLQIAEDEEQFLSSKGNEDLLSYYLEITSLEKESLVKQINALEEEIAQGRKL